MDDKELLERAAKAAGIERLDFGKGMIITYDEEGHSVSWNPLVCDGDALRLAVTLGLSIITIGINGDGVCVYKPIVGHVEVNEAHGDDPIAATRRAIVRAAAALAEIGDLHDR